MGWSIGEFEGRDIGYGVPAICDHPGCGEEINRGLSYVCGGRPYGGEYGCGLFFCEKHRYFSNSEKIREQICHRCLFHRSAFEPSPDVPEWINHKLTDESWQQWRDENPEEVEELRARLNRSDTLNAGQR